ncbi:MAG: alginate export family protein [Pseudohongiella sp.]|nr:alginate export family protein [Pseudohongiella sp.]
MIRLVCLLLCATFAANHTFAQSSQPWRLVEATEQTRVQFSHVLRMENLTDQFRAGRQGSSDQVLLSRSLMMAELRRERATFGLELLDARQALADTGSSLSSGMINTATLQQLYVNANLGEVVQSGSKLGLKFGRQTLDLGSRRMMARSAYNLAPLSMTGALADFTTAAGQRWQAFYFLPVQNVPGDLQSLLKNRTERDRESKTARLWGVFNEMPALAERMRGDFYYIRLDEKDRYDQPSANRELNNFGARVFRPAASQQLDFEVEAIFQRGTSHASAAVTDVRALDHRAHFYHAEMGYTFDSAWRIRLQAQFDYASGDKDPSDGTNGRFDTLYGDRRFDFGPTGLFGPFSRANLVSAGYRLTATPMTGVRVMLAHRDYRLAEAKDQWVGTGLRDSSGRSGRGLGQQVEVRVQWDVVPGNITIEGGAAVMATSGFARRVPGADTPASTSYAYLQSTLSF